MLLLNYIFLRNNIWELSHYVLSKIQMSALFLICKKCSFIQSFFSPCFMFLQDSVVAGSVEEGWTRQCCLGEL